MNEQVALIQEWARERDIDKEEVRHQLLVTMEELGEVAAAVRKMRPQAFKDGIGDVFVTLVTACMAANVDISECIQVAYDEIKDRRGMIQNGTFVKAADLPGGVSP